MDDILSVLTRDDSFQARRGGGQVSCVICSLLTAVTPSPLGAAEVLLWVIVSCQVKCLFEDQQRQMRPNLIVSFLSVASECLLVSSSEWASVRPGSPPGRQASAPGHSSALPRPQAFPAQPSGPSPIVTKDN